LISILYYLGPQGSKHRRQWRNSPA